MNGGTVKMDTLADAGQPQADAGQPQADAINILIVDDDATIRYLLHEFMRMQGYDSEMAGSAEEALEILKEHQFQVVISDIMLPGLDGLELTALIKKHYDSDVIVITGYSADYSYEDAIDKGASDFVFKPVRFEELLLRLKRVLRERELKHKLQTLAITDGLTRLYNSRHFYDQLEKEIDRALRYHHALSLIMMDIDFFKNYNDCYGHLEGDKVLAGLGETIRACLRKTDTAYRYGGEEFTVILPETGADDALVVARRIQEQIKNRPFYPLDENAVHITVSVGVTDYAPGEDMLGLVKRADQALFDSKRSGRDKITLTPAARFPLSQ